ncbi:MAG: KpsF/GutQ family sugar-phosphate isomerase [Haliscomenobacter sp.]|nr:KpsF/GutQ family sugar-phosphate isomerase [Haliscomenobacter sp.]
MGKTEALILETARRTLEIEVETLQKLRESLESSFVSVVEAIFKSSGRTIVTGIGKSALVAQKIVATLNSTGTPASFLHAGDAIHGDLGMIRPEDIVICLSKSGETPEIKVLTPLVRHMGNMLVGMVSRKDSFLGRQADFVLLTPIDQEADPNNLAPTASTTAQMALGDAMATALLALRGFTPQDFAQYHPGGALGKQLYLRVNDLYPLHEQPSVFPDDSLQKIILEMTSKRLGMTAVVDEHQRLLGIITDGDLRRMLEKNLDFSTLFARNIMSPQPKTIHPEAMAVEALGRMRKHSITQLLVCDDDHVYLGVIHLHDLIREGLI